MSDIDREKRETRRQKIKEQKRKRIIAWAIVVIVAILIVFGLIKLLGWIFTPKYVESANIGPNPVAEGATAQITPAPRYYDYTAPAPEADAVDDSYFDSVLMIGEGRTSGFPLYGYMTNASFLASGNVNVSSVESYEFEYNSGTTTLVDLLGSNRYDAIYIEVGLNELGWSNSSAFVDSYSSLINTIKSLAPQSSIYMQSIIPVTASKSGSPEYITNEKVAEYNALIKDIATSQQVYYLDMTEALTGGTGQLTGGYAGSDGMALSKDGYTKWIDYIKTHVVNKEIYS